MINLFILLESDNLILDQVMILYYAETIYLVDYVENLLYIPSELNAKFYEIIENKIISI